MRVVNNTTHRPGRQRVALHLYTLGVIVSLVVSVLAVGQSAAEASSSDGVGVSCPPGMTLHAATSTCTSTATISVDPVAETTTKCPEGFTKNTTRSDTDDIVIFPDAIYLADCIKRTTTTSSPEPRTQWGCPEGSTKTGGQNEATVCEAPTTTKEEVPADSQIEYSCPDEYRLIRHVDGRRCSRPSTPERIDPAPEVTELGCPVGKYAFGLAPHVMCYTQPKGKGIATFPKMVTTYRCPAGTSPIGAVGPDLQCKTPARAAHITAVIETETFSCPRGAQEVPGSAPLKCERTIRSSTTVDPVKTTTYHCETKANPPTPFPIRNPAVDKDAVCEHTSVETADEETVTVYSCPEGAETVDGTQGENLKCEKMTTVEMPASMTCGGHPVTVDMNKGQKPTKGDDVILGTQGPDKIRSKSGHDIVCGWGGDDVIKSGGGHDTVYGGDGNDKIKGGGGKDTIKGGNGNDVADGGRGKDRLHGDDGDDMLKGGKGRDTLHGGADTDSCDGGPHKNKIDPSCES